MVFLILEKPSTGFEDSLIDDFISRPWFGDSLVSKMRCKPFHQKRKQRAKLIPGTEINQDKDRFQVCMDIHQFSPDEISVKTSGRQVIVEAKHDERDDGQGLVSRHFVRKYNLPDGYRPEDVSSSLSSDGFLTVSAPKITKQVSGERIVPIKATGPIHSILDEKSKEKPEEPKPQKMDV